MEEVIKENPSSGPLDHPKTPLTTSGTDMTMENDNTQGEGTSLKSPSGSEPLGKIRHQKHKQKFKRLTMEDLFSPLQWSQYITFNVNEDEDMPSDISIYRALKSILNTEIINFSADSNKVIVKAENEAQSKLLLETKKLGNKVVTPSSNNQYNKRTGTMLLDRLRLGADESDHFIADAIKEVLFDQLQNVSEVQIFERSFKTQKSLKMASHIQPTNYSSLHENGKQKNIHQRRNS